MAREKCRGAMGRLRDALGRCTEALARLKDTHFLGFPLLGQITSTVQSLQTKCGTLWESLDQNQKLSYLVGYEYVEAAQKLCDELGSLAEQWTRETSLTSSEERGATVLQSKLEVVELLLMNSFALPENDLFNLERSHPRWRFLWDQVDYHRPSDLRALESSLADATQRMMLSSAVLSLGLECSSATMGQILTVSGLLYYGLRIEEALEQGKVNAAYPEVQFIRMLLGIAESKLCSKVFDSMLVSVPVSQRIYVPMVSTCVTETEMYSSLTLPISPRAGSGAFTTVPFLSRPSVPVRIISPYSLPSLYPEDSPSGWGLCCSRSIDTEDPHLPDKVILHIHGGGWIAMSSHTHENYTRKWALGTKALVLSVDYRLAPEHPYPAALEDVWEAYIWTLKFSKKHLGVDPRKIIIAGDSAGGNLALALTFKALEMRVRPPDGLLLTYPALNMNLQTPTGSYLMSFEDVVLSQGIMMLCNRCYVPPGADVRDPHVSPLMASDELLRQLPPLRLMIGSKDPLLDDSWRFFERLKLLGNDVKMTLFEGLIHGVLNFDMKMGLPQAQEMVAAGCQYLKELLYLASATR